MSEALFEIFGVTVTITGIYGTISVIVLILFMSLWLAGRKKRSGKEIFAGQVMNGIGFGLLPALAVLKAFQETRTGTGSKVLDPLPAVRWLTENGYNRPGRIETAAAAVCFILLCLWLIIRKHELPDNGDLLIISVCIWAAIRLVTEEFRSEPQDLFRYTSCGTILLCMAIWTVRCAYAYHMPARSVSEMMAVSICIAINLLTAKGVLSVGSGVGDFAVKTGSTMLALLLTMISGADLRRMLKSENKAESGK